MKGIPTLFALSAFLLVAGSGHALERRAVPADRDPAQPWTAAATCTVTYANTCTGWLWVWGDWGPGDQIGVVFDPCCDGGALTSTQAYFWTGSCAGYGYTGTLAVCANEGGCPGVAYDSHPQLPPVGPVIDTWTGIPAGSVVLRYTPGPGVGSPHTIPTDHPAAGPTGPQSCGLCFPSTRPIHTFYWGTEVAPLCPGEPFNDGICDAEALYWYAGFDGCATPAENTSWGLVKQLYR